MLDDCVEQEDEMLNTFRAEMKEVKTSYGEVVDDRGLEVMEKLLSALSFPNFQCIVHYLYSTFRDPYIVYSTFFRVSRGGYIVLLFIYMH